VDLDALQVAVDDFLEQARQAALAKLAEPSATG